jgi:ABC-type Fe3+ transport system substrate-binding protein
VTRTTPIIRFALLAVVLALVAGACGGGTTAAPSVAPTVTPSPKPTFTTKQQALIDAAKKEGALNFVSSVLNSKDEQKLFESFKTYYGLTDLKFTYAQGPQFPQLQAQLLQEFQANKPASTDVFVGTETHFIALGQANAVDKIDWVGIGGNINKASLVDGENTAVEFVTHVIGLQYNTQKVRTPPTSLQDLLKPEYKGIIGTTAFASGFVTLGSPQLWGPDKAVSYYTQFVKQIQGQMNCGEEERTISGEFPIFAMDCGGGRIQLLKKQGATIEFVVPSDAAITNRWYLGVPANAQHKAAATLFIDYLLSAEAQKVIRDVNGFDEWQLPDSISAKVIKDYEAKAVKFVHWGISTSLADTKAGAKSVRGTLLGILQSAAK